MDPARGNGERTGDGSLLPKFLVHRREQANAFFEQVTDYCVVRVGRSLLYSTGGSGRFSRCL